MTSVGGDLLRPVTSGDVPAEPPPGTAAPLPDRDAGRGLPGAPDGASDGVLDGAPDGVRPQHVAGRSLAEVADRLGVLPPPASGATEVRGLSLASARVRPGDLFAALPGARGHGADFAAAATAAGAVAFLTDPDGAARIAAAAAIAPAGAIVGDRPAGDRPAAELPVLVVDAPRQRLGALASWLYGDPSGVVDVLAVTGTSGKTSVTYLLEAGLEGAGRAAGVVGTTGTRIAGRPVRSALTTPEAPDLHALLAVMAERGVRDAAVEVSSHALVLGRVDGLRARVALFTNLGRDHLDFHASMADYLDAKARLFTPEHTAAAVVCLDGGVAPDEDAGVVVARRAAAAGVDVTTLAVRSGSASHALADWAVTDAAPDGRGSRFTLRDPHGLVHAVRIELPGAFQVANAALAVVALAVAGHDLDAVVSGVGRCRAVPGRLERVDAGQPFLAVVDYAHKPPALQAVLGALTPGPNGRLIVVLGAGGDRDRGKRPLMGAVAAHLADVVVVTDDNPRSEEPAAIRSAILAGANAVEAEGRAEIIEATDRASAIVTAVQWAHPGDVVLVAGKGHETGQEINGVQQHFDDREELARAISTTVPGTKR